MELELIAKSIDWRKEKGIDLDHSFRLFAGISDGVEGLLIEKFGPFVLASLYNPILYEDQNEILSFLNNLFPDLPILIKARTPSSSGKFQYSGNQNYKKDLIVKCREKYLSMDLEFEVHMDPRHDFGLYLDTKEARSFIFNNSKNKNILNLFAYTCAFGIAAMKGGAQSVTNIDPNKDYLNWGQNSANLNGVVFKKYPDTTQDYLARHVRRLESGKDQPYDLIIVDPPAFLVGRGSDRLARNLWPVWFESLKKSGCQQFLIVINDKSLGRQKNLNNFFQEGLGDEISIERIPQSFDVEGQGVSFIEDNYYFNPEVYIINKGLSL